MSELDDWRKVAAQLYHALGSMCRCQMVGGERWHLQAKMEVAQQCAFCAARKAYEEFVQQPGETT